MEETAKIKLDRFMTMCQYAPRVFARELSHYDLTDSMHLMCPQINQEGPDLGGFIINITPGTPYEEIARENVVQHWRGRVAELRAVGKPFDFWANWTACKLPGPGYRFTGRMMPEDEYKYMMKEVGDLFLGWEIGECDGLFGRDVAYYWKPEERPKTRREAHDRVLEYLTGIQEMLYRNTNALCGVTFAHYFNELPVRMLGAEVGQALLNNQVYISFLRGACRQYDLQYKIMSSIFDRWGYRCYTDSADVVMRNEDGEGAWKAGRYYGHGVGLLRAIWVTSYFAEATIVGLDGGYYSEELVDGVRQLSPLGKAFIEFTRWARNPYPRGTQVRPIALMLDYYAGWTPPRHLYSFEERVVWHALPYGPSDHAMDQAYDIFYPGYCKAGYYRDERGFISPTPVGDVVDVLLSDAGADAMSRYPIIWLLSDESPDSAFMSRLKGYVESGGHLIVGGPPMPEIASAWFGMTIGEDRELALVSIISETCEEVREANYSVRALPLDEKWHICAETESGRPVIASAKLGGGTVTFIAADHGLTDDMTAPGFDLNRSLQYTPDPPYETLHAVQWYVKELVRELVPVEVVGSGVYYSVNDLGDGRYAVCVYNPGIEPWTGHMRAKDGGGVFREVDGPWNVGALVGDNTITLRGNEVTVLEALMDQTGESE